MKNLRYVFLAALTAAVLCGCYPQGEPIYTGADSAQSDIVDDDIKNFRLDAEISDDCPASVPVLRIKFKKFDTDRTVNAFFRGEEYAVDRTSEQYGTMVYMNDEKELTITSHGDLFFNYEKDGAPLMAYYEKLFYTSRYYLNEYPGALSEIDGFPKSEALSRAKALLDELGIENLGEPQIITGTAGEMNRFFQNDPRSRWKDVSFDESDSFYSLTFPSEYNGVEVSGSLRRLPSCDHHDSFTKIIMTKDRVISLDCRLPIDDAETVGEVGINTDMRAAAASLREFYKLKNPQDEYVFDSAGLKYLTCDYSYENGYADYTPVWEFSGHYEASDDGNTWKKAEIIDVKTGTVLAGSMG